MTTFFDLDRVFLFTLLIARAAGLVAVAPFFGERFVPRNVNDRYPCASGTRISRSIAVALTPSEPASPRQPRHSTLASCPRIRTSWPK